MTIDFSSRIESGVKEVFPEVTTQKCIFHTIQLLLRGLIKELTRVKNDRLIAHIKEWSRLSRLSIAIEKDQEVSEVKQDTSFRRLKDLEDQTR